MDTITTISTVTPVYSGGAFLQDLIKKIEIEREYLQSVGSNIHIIESIFVIDECIDNSQEVLIAQSKLHSWIKIIELSKNYGQHPATTAGILYSSGDWLVTLDEDLQHQPSDIFQMLFQAIKTKSDVCYGRSINKVHSSFVRDTLSKVFKSILSNLTDNAHITKFSSYRVIRGSIARAAASISNFETYFDIALGWFTNRVSVIEISMEDLRNKNSPGKSGYSILGLFKHGKRMLMTSKMKILRGGIIIGIISFTLSLILVVFAISSKYFQFQTDLVKGWASLFVVTLFFGGLSSLLIGFVLESVTDILISSKGKPNYFVVDRSNDSSLLDMLYALKEKIDVGDS